MENAKPAKLSNEDLERINRLQNDVISSASGQNVVLVAYEKE